MDVTLLHRFIHYSMTSWFDATAPYHPTAVGVYSRLGRRPSSEAATNRNRTIAALHANYQVVRSVEPGREPAFRELLVSVEYSDHTRARDYKRSVDEILEASAYDWVQRHIRGDVRQAE
ncbi:DUF6851 domain-containing protein [Phytohabitans suffuscus]